MYPVSLSLHHTEYQAHHVVFNDESIVYIIFCQLAMSVQQLATLALVRRSWQQLTSHSSFWEKICLQAGISIPLDVNRSRLAYRYEKSSLFLEQVRACQTPVMEMIDLKVDFSGNKMQIQFVEDRYLIANNRHEVKVYDLEDRSLINEMSFEEEIGSVCTSRNQMIICNQYNEMTICALIAEKNENQGQAFTLKGYKSTSMTSPSSKAALLANNQWLVLNEDDIVQQWNLDTRECVSNTLATTIHSLEINQNRLYGRVTSESGICALVYADLDQCPLHFNTLSTSIPYEIRVQNSVAFYLALDEIVDSDSSDEENTEVIENPRIMTLDLNTSIVKETSLYGMSIEDGYSLITINGLAILVHNDDNPQLHAIELIDLESHDYLMKFARGSIYRDSLTAFQGTLLYLSTNNQVVKMTFPPLEAATPHEIEIEEVPSNGNKRTAEEAGLENSAAKKGRF